MGLRVERGGTVILEDVNWRVGAREHWVILGANGSGKTSLLAALTGYLMPTAGEIEVLGERYGESDWRELRCKVGIVSSSVRQMMADHEPALATVVSGRLAEINLWREVTVAERRAARRIRVVTGRTSARVDRSRVDGEAEAARPGRAVRGFGSGSAGAFSAIY